MGIGEVPDKSNSLPPLGGKGPSLPFFATLAVILALFGALFWSSYDSRHREALVTANNLATVLAADIGNALDRARSDLRVFVPQITADDLSGHATEARRTAIEALMGAHLRSFPAVLDYRVFDATGQTVFGAGSVNPHARFNVADRAWFQQLRDHPNLDSVISEVVIGRGAPTQMVILGVPLRDGEGHLVGALNAAVNLAYFQALIDGLDVGRNGLVTIRRADDYRMILRRPEMEGQINEPLRETALSDAVRSGRPRGEGDFVSVLDHVRRIYAFRTLHDYPVTVIVAVAAADYLRSWWAQTALGGVAVLGLLVVLVVLHHRQRRAQTRLASLAETLRLSEGRLADEAARFRATFEQAAVGVIHASVDGRILRCNARFAEFIGYPPGEAAALTMQRITAPDDLARSAEAMHRLLGGEIDSVALEKRYIRKDGTLTWGKITLSIQRDGEGRMLHFIAVVEDINARKDAEERLAAAMDSVRDSEERFRSLVEGTTDWAWETDASHCIAWLSPSFEQVMGIPSAAILGHRRWDLASREHDIDPALWQAHMEDLGAHRSFRDFRYWVPTEGGEARWITVSGSPRFAADGSFLGYRGSGSDITSEAGAALRLKMLSTAVEQSPVSVVITDPDGIIEYVNSHLTAATGYAPAEVIGGNSRIFASGDTPPEVYRDLWATIKAGRRWAGELRNRRKNGEPRWEAIIIAPVLNDEGRVAHYVAVKEDVTERRRLEDRLRQTNAELEQFAYVASHDLRQPLRMVSSYLGLIERRLGPGLDGDIKEFLDFAIGGARNMDRLILDLLDYSRTGRTGGKVAVPLADAVAEARLNLAVAIQEAGADLAVAEGLPTVAGDPTELARLFQNLIGNAVKYRAPDRRPKVEIACRRQGGEWLVSVKDNGIGIAPEDRERAFNIFQRLVPNDTCEGTGIGLAVCRKIVEHHGGRIWVESGLGSGSTFFVTLPAAAP